MNREPRLRVGVSLALILACAIGAGLGTRGADHAAAQADAAETEATNRAAAHEVSGGAAPQTPKKAIWGLASHNGKSMFPIYRDLGVGIWQTQARWDQIAPLIRPADATDADDPAYRWPNHLEQSIAEAERHGMEVSIQLIGTPAWANGGHDWRWAADEPSDFGNFATAIARKFPGVNLWMIWGEPNREENFAPFTGAKPNAKKLTKQQARAPRAYSELLDAAYGALKADSPANLVIGGSTYFSGGKGVIRPYPWIRYMRLPGGGRPRMDMWGHNPYSYRKPKLKSRPSPLGRVDFSDLGRLAKALDRAFPRPRLRLFLSEWGVPTGNQDVDFRFRVSTETSVKWIRAAFRIVRSWDRVYTLGWSVPVDNPTNSQGLLYSDGYPKPGYYAFKEG